MSTEDLDTLRTINGLDGSRRVAWAKYYAVVRQLEDMEKAAHSMLTQAVAFAQEIRKNEFLANDDRIVGLAEEFLRRVALTSKGAKLVERVKGSRKERKVVGGTLVVRRAEAQSFRQPLPPTFTRGT